MKSGAYCKDEYILYTLLYEKQRLLIFNILISFKSWKKIRWSHYSSSIFVQHATLSLKTSKRTIFGETDVHLRSSFTDWTKTLVELKIKKIIPYKFLPSTTPKTEWELTVDIPHWERKQFCLPCPHPYKFSPESSKQMLILSLIWFWRPFDTSLLWAQSETPFSMSARKRNSSPVNLSTQMQFPVSDQFIRFSWQWLGLRSVLYMFEVWTLSTFCSLLWVLNCELQIV